ncbi:MAG: hypothetical protein KDK56_07585 [Simkania sp.]|nr:hypothetical protein [Simkania sp.]MCP5490281.1 hypothetical protein [Chlamydiales bacterium]
MRKALIIIFGVIVVIVLVGIFCWNMLPSWISHKLSDRAKVSVSIQAIRLGSSSIKVDNIRVGNPPGSILDTALEVKSLYIGTPFSNFFHDNIVIDEMRLDNVYLGLEFESQRSTNGNWSEIMQNLKESTGKEKQAASSKGTSTSVLIKKLIITDLKIDLAYRTGNKGVRRLRTIDRLELNNISSEGGIPTAQIMDIVISEMLRSVFSKEGLQNMLENVMPGSKSGGGAMDTLKGLFSDLILLDNNWDDIFYEEAE